MFFCLLATLLCTFPGLTVTRRCSCSDAAHIFSRVWDDLWCTMFEWGRRVHNAHAVDPVYRLKVNKSTIRAKFGAHNMTLLSASEAKPHDLRLHYRIMSVPRVRHVPRNFALYLFIYYTKIAHKGRKRKVQKGNRRFINIRKSLQSSTWSKAFTASKNSNKQINRYSVTVVYATNSFIIDRGPSARNGDNAIKARRQSRQTGRYRSSVPRDGP